MNTTQVFPALGERHEKRVSTRLSWTKKGPGRRHNRLSGVQQRAKDALMFRVGMTATQALTHLQLL